jgi:hypothetical protein
MNLSRLEKFYMATGLLLLLFSFIILLLSWPFIPETYSFKYKDPHDSAKEIIGWGKKTTLLFVFYMPSMSIFMEFLCLKFYWSSGLTPLNLWPDTPQNREVRCRITRSSFCLCCLANCSMFIVLEWECIRRALGEIESINSFIFLSMAIWMPLISVYRLYLIYRTR